MKTTERTIYLVSADMPGCGSSTLSRQIHTLTGCEILEIGKTVRDALGVSNERELTQNLDKISDPMDFDKPLYENLQKNINYIIDGKLATTLGPHYLAEDRLIKVDLISSYLLSAKRILQRETGRNALISIVTPEGAAELLRIMSGIKVRAEHDQGMRSKIEDRMGIIPHANMERHLFDTTTMPVGEIIRTLFNESSPYDKFAEYELDSLYENMQSMREVLAFLDRTQKIHPSDIQHIDHTLSRLEYKLKRLHNALLQDAVHELRPDIRNILIHGWANLMGRHAPRFCEVDGDIQLDKLTVQYSPEYYKVSELYQVFRHQVSNKTILDPFGGSGMMLNIFSMRGIAREITLTDIKYRKNLNTYLPMLNKQAWYLAFDNLPSWYRPKCCPIKIIAMDARELKFPDKTFDFVITDPPYGKNCADGDLQIVKDSIPEMFRVAKEGIFMLIPEVWIDKLGHNDYSVYRITKDTSSGLSGLPTCWVRLVSTHHSA